MTRNRLPLWLLVILATIWGRAIIGGYMQPDEELLDETSEGLVLHAWDRTLRVNDALKDAPDWQKWMLNYDATDDSIGSAAESLALLEKYELLENEGEFALAITERQLGEKANVENLRAWQRRAYMHQPLNAKQWERWQRDLDDGKVTWWDLELVKSYAEATKDQRFLDEVERENQRTIYTMHAAACAYAFVWLLVLIGLAFVPHAWKQLRSLGRQRREDRCVSYPLHWSIKVIFVLFFATELFADQVMEYLGFLYYIIDDEYWPNVIGDTLWRMIPAILMMFILFRNPKWLIDRFGLNQKPRWAIILAVFGVLSILDPALYALIGFTSDTDPTMGLDPMENGWRGLGYGLLSACIMAPVMEELIFRGFLMNPMLRKWGFWIAALVTTLLFAISHYYDLYGTISVGLFGFSAAAIYYLTRSLTNTIILHVIYNFTITVPMWLLFHHQA